MLNNSCYFRITNYIFRNSDTCNLILSEFWYLQLDTCTTWYCIFNEFCLITWYLILPILLQNLRLVCKLAIFNYCYPLLATCYLLPVTCYLLLATCYMLSVTYYLIVDCTCYLIVSVWDWLSETCYYLQEIVSFRSCSATRSCFFWWLPLMDQYSIFKN